MSGGGGPRRKGAPPVRANASAGSRPNTGPGFPGSADAARPARNPGSSGGLSF
eukprot:CAMPEP_0206404386 /NCGR_PEP_ID=MMETSP0294-20121207/28341_1 /ASSEMBLY_ACC=CAM_ASM_000327 /TAXON_ID=39354 /ORGANISM="Heterosigma akashiwo, Strain CCMP2393" /LENGTH=52 /DNA_ID=CAMNT_0053862281 /DNA_START=161 /DNA_END=319 /DNA_ORIENTATION=-